MLLLFNTIISLPASRPSFPRLPYGTLPLCSLPFPYSCVLSFYSSFLFFFPSSSSNFFLLIHFPRFSSPFLLVSSLFIYFSCSPSILQCYFRSSYSSSLFSFNSYSVFFHFSFSSLSHHCSRSSPALIFPSFNPNYLISIPTPCSSTFLTSEDSFT